MLGKGVVGTKLGKKKKVAQEDVVEIREKEHTVGPLSPLRDLKFRQFQLLWKEYGSCMRASHNIISIYTE